LLQKSGDFIADLLGVEAALVTSGAAAAGPQCCSLHGGH